MNLIKWFWTKFPAPTSKQRAKVSKIGQNSLVWFINKPTIWF